MINFEAIKLSLQEWLVRSSGLLDERVVFSDQADVRPVTPYIAFKIISNTDIGQNDTRGSIDDNGYADFIGNRELTVSIQCFGEGAMSLISRVRDSINNCQEMDILRSEGLVFVDQLLFSDITELLDTKWEERGQLDILFRTVSISNYNVGTIERVEVMGKIKDLAGNITHEHSFSVVKNLDVGNLVVITESTNVTLL